MSKNNRFYSRRFLNKRRYHGGAYIIAEVTTTTNKDKDGEWTSLDGRLTISDCSRVVTLDFDYWEGGLSSLNQNDKDNLRFKVKNLREVVDGFCDSLEAAIEELND